MGVIIETNKYQTPITDELLNMYPKEVAGQFMDYMDTVPLLKWMIGDRPRAKDLERDSLGRIKVDITHPHILENMDYFRQAVIFYQENGCYTFLKKNSNPNSQYGKWFREEVRRCREGYVRESDGEWVTGQMYWFINYCPIMISKKSETTGIVHRIEGFPALWEGIYYRFHYLEQARANGKHGVELARRGAGKAHPYTEKVITPDGEKMWGDIKVGDYLFGDDGMPTMVTDIPFDDYVDTYRITLRDGRSVLASDEHLWRVIIHNHKKEEILSTKEMMGIYARNRKKSERNPCGIEYICGIPCNKRIEFNERETKIDPYTFGFLLGDGCFSHPCCCFTQHPSDMSVLQNLFPYEIKKWSEKYAYNMCIPEWKKTLDYYGLNNAKSEDKFIPDEFKYNTSEVRTALLKGLIDTDGWLDKHSVYCITTVSERLANDIRWLCWSLGYNNSIVRKKSGYKKDGKYKQCLDSYTISIYTTDVLSNIPRKIRGGWNSKYAMSRAVQSRVVDIQYVGRVKSKCVTVDNNSHCYLIGDFVVTHNSYSMAGIMSHNLILGEDSEATRRVATILTAYTKEYLSQKDGTFSKFTPIIDFTAANTEFPRLFLIRRSSDMIWEMGYKNSNGNELGSLNSVMGLSVKADEGKIRGKRGFILFEEMGNFPNFKDVWDNVRDSVKNGDDVFSLLYAIGTAGDDESDFSGIRTILYNPEAYEVYALDNVYDKNGRGAEKFAYFFPSYISREGCMDKDGNSDVVKALLQILNERYLVKKAGDSASLLKRISQIPVTPEEAILRTRSTFFPTLMLNERLRQIDSLPHFYDDVYVGELVDVGGKVEFKTTNVYPIRKYPIDSFEEGALEIFNLPQKGTIPNNRYIIGVDPVENDQARSKSLMSVIVFDLYNDEIVAEYTGRMQMAEDGYEVVRLLAKFYNAQIMYESNRRGMYAYFSKMKSVWMLADCPDWIRAKDLVKYNMFGSSIKGVSVNPALINTGIDLINSWLKKTKQVEMRDENGEVHIENVPQLYSIRNRALLQELVSYAPEKNTDRVSAMFQVMFLREQYNILYGDAKYQESNYKDAADDEFFSVDWERHKARIDDSYKHTLGL